MKEQRPFKLQTEETKIDIFEHLSYMTDNLLPISLNILSKINLENKNFIITDNPLDTLLLYKYDIININYHSDIVCEIEYNAIKSIVDYINEELKEKNNFEVYSMVSDIKLINKNNIPEYSIFGRIKIY